MVQTALGATYSLGQTPDLWDVAGGTDANVDVYKRQLLHCLQFCPIWAYL